MARSATSVVTVERDRRRAAIAAERLRPLANVRLLTGEWQELLPSYGPYDLLFHDAGDFKRAPYEHGERVLGLLAPGALLVLDDMTPGWPGRDSIREWVNGRSELAATEILTTPASSALLVSRV